MFQNSERQFIELVNQVYSRVDVEQIVVRDFLTMQLVEHIIELAIELSSLVRVFTIAQVHRIIYGSTKMRTLVIVEVIEDCRIVA